MYWNNMTNQYFQQLNGYLYSQSKQIEQLRQLIEQLTQEVSQLKEKSTPSVVNNQYKFDLLKVEKLEGTLNIGINPNTPDTPIEELNVGQSIDVPSEEKKKLVQDVHQQMEKYLDQEARDTLISVESKFDYPLQEEYRNFIIEDVKKQVNQRIQHYVKQIPNEQITTSDQVKKWNQSILNKVKQDIHKTFEAFIKNLPKETPS